MWLDRLRKGIWPKSLVFWVVAFYMACFIIRPWEKIFPELADLRFERIMVLLVAGTVIFTRGPFVRVTLQNVAMILLYAAVWLSGRDPYDPELTSPQVTEFLGFLISYFIIQKTVKSPYQMLFIIACYLVATAAYVFKSEWEYAFNGAAWYMMGVKRLQGDNYTFGHPNNLGITMNCSLPIALFFYRVRGTFCQTWPKLLRKAFCWMLPVYMAAAVLGVILTRSRASAMGLLVFLALLVVRKPTMSAKLKWAGSFMLICVIGFFMAPDDIRYRIQSTWDRSVEFKAGMGGANSSAEGRMEGLLAGLEIFERFPITGVGIGSFAAYRVIYVDGVELDAHNLPGEVLGELGIVGGVAFLIFFTAMCMNCWKLLKMGREFQDITGNPTYWLLGVGLADAFVLIIYGGVSCHNLQYYQWYWYATFMVCGVTYVKQELRRVKDELGVDEGLAVGDQVRDVDDVMVVDGSVHA